MDTTFLEEEVAAPKRRIGKINAIPETLQNLVVPIERLCPYPTNPRSGNLPAIRASLRKRGQYRPVVARVGSGEVVAGNHVLLAAQQEGWTEVAATFIDVSDKEAAEIVLADNRLAELGGYQDQALVDLLGSLDDLSGTGWEESDISALLISIEANTLKTPAADDKEKKAPGTDRHLVTCKVVLAVEAIGTVEQALQATGEWERGKALEMICAEYLEKHHD